MLRCDVVVLLCVNYFMDSSIHPNKNIPFQTRYLRHSVLFRHFEEQSDRLQCQNHRWTDGPRDRGAGGRRSPEAGTYNSPCEAAVTLALKKVNWGRDHVTSQYRSSARINTDPMALGSIKIGWTLWRETVMSFSSFPPSVVRRLLELVVQLWRTLTSASRTAT